MLENTDIPQDALAAMRALGFAALKQALEVVPPSDAAAIVAEVNSLTMQYVAYFLKFMAVTGNESIEAWEKEMEKLA